MLCLCLFCAISGDLWILLFCCRSCRLHAPLCMAMADVQGGIVEFIKSPREWQERKVEMWTETLCGVWKY